MVQGVFDDLNPRTRRCSTITMVPSMPECGFQRVPVDWRINAPRKRAFFNLVAQMTGCAACF